MKRIKAACITQTLHVLLTLFYSHSFPARRLTARPDIRPLPE